MQTGLLIMAGFFALFHALWIIGYFAMNKQKLKKLLDTIMQIMFELSFELGKTLLIAGIVGIYFIPDKKDFTKAFVGGIMLFIVGFIAKNKKG